MLIVAGTLEVAPEGRDEFLRGREESIRTSRAEPGCIAYVLSADPIEPGIVHLFERWESKEALGAHLGAMPPQPADSPVLGREIQQYEIASVGALGS